ncbi:MAG: TMEM175 family protein [Gemmatimonadaceae bacterium]
MIRKHVFGVNANHDSGFIWRSREVSRLEGFSDAVIGFAVTLLVVSLEVPKTLDDLLISMGGFVAFGFCFALLVLIWHTQYTWFRRYGLDDTPTFLLTMVLLFVVLFFVYPLKFFTAFMMEWVRSGDFRHFPSTLLADGRSVQMIGDMGQLLKMMTIYSAGYAAVFGIFALMYWHAWRRREELDLSDLEEIETRFSLMEHAMHFAVGLLGAILASVAHSAFAMFAFFLIAPLQILQGNLRSRARKKIEALGPTAS